MLEEASERLLKTRRQKRLLLYGNWKVIWALVGWYTPFFNNHSAQVYTIQTIAGDFIPNPWRSPFFEPLSLGHKKPSSQKGHGWSRWGLSRSCQVMKDAFFFGASSWPKSCTQIFHKTCRERSLLLPRWLASGWFQWFWTELPVSEWIWTKRSVEGTWMIIPLNKWLVKGVTSHW